MGHRARLGGLAARCGGSGTDRAPSGAPPASCWGLKSPAKWSPQGRRPGRSREPSSGTSCEVTLIKRTVYKTLSVLIDN